jgi:uncharacterized DUF497 family protein
MFEWDAANIAHIAEHDVLPLEEEGVLTNNPLDLSCEFRNQEQRIPQVGETSSGRILFVISTVRNELTRVVTAYPANRSLRAIYLANQETTGDGKESSS